MIPGGHEFYQAVYDIIKREAATREEWDEYVEKFDALERKVEEYHPSEGGNGEDKPAFDIRRDWLLALVVMLLFASADIWGRVIQAIELLARIAE